jgi:hypothetical protein
MSVGKAQGKGSRLKSYLLLDALISRRSRRFAKGMSLNGGPLAYESAKAPEPLSLEEEAALAFAGCGVTGPTLAELPYESGSKREAGSGNIIINFVGRTVASAEAVHATTLFVMGDGGAWMLKRPQDYPRDGIPELVRKARDGQFTELYEKARIKVTNRRPDPPRELPFVLPFNKWSANVSGTTYFLPVAEISAFYINFLLSAFSEEFSTFVADERNGFKPAGIAKFARSKGGHLQDDPKAGRYITIGIVETCLYEFVAIEQGGMLQNLALMGEALGLGGFPHFAAHPFAWFEALDFRMQDIPLSRTIGAGLLTKTLIRALGKEFPVPTAVGFERNGEALMKPYCPPYYRDMEEAVLAFVDYKYSRERGTLRDGGSSTSWKHGADVQAGIPAYSDAAIAATIAYCEYVYSRYGRFPANSGPFRTVLAHQAHRLDEDFYERFYKPEALPVGTATGEAVGDQTPGDVE